MRKIYRGILTALILLGVLAGAISVGAWLVTEQRESFRLGADDTPDISIKSAKYDGRQYVWDTEWTTVDKNHINETPFGDPFNPGKFDPNASSGHATDALRVQCQFGEINNLNSLNDSNYGWYCIRIHEEEGLQFSNLGVRYSFTNDKFFGSLPYTFYGANWVDHQVQSILPMGSFEGAKKDALKTALGKASGTLDNLMRVEGAWVSTKAPVNGGHPYTLTKNSQNFVSKAAGKGPFSGSTEKVDQDGYYYVYFSVYPNLDAYHNMVNVLNEFMPCYLTFHPLVVEIDVSTQEPAAK